MEDPTPTPDPELPQALAARVNRRLRRGILVTMAGVAALSLFTTLPFWDVLGIPLFHLLLPALALAQLPLLRVTRLERIPVYVGSMVTILALGTVGLALGLRLEGWAGLGLYALPPGELALWTLGITGAGLAVIVALVPLDRRLSPHGPELMAELLPRTRREKGVFAGLSLSAGVGEELAYRGYALVSLQLLGAGPWLAAILSSVAFGVLHAYQGFVGVVRTGVLGFLLALPLLVTGSLLPSIAAHTLIDLGAGLVFGPRWLSSADSAPLVEPPASR